MKKTNNNICLMQYSNDSACIIPPTKLAAQLDSASRVGNNLRDDTKVYNLGDDTQCLYKF